MEATTSSGAAESRRARKKQRTHRQIFEAAMSLFAARGYDAVPIEEICEAADVARGTFFLHFPSKAAVLEERGRELADQIAAGLAASEGGPVGEYRMLVEHFGDRWLRGADDRPDVMAALLRELVFAPRADRPDVAEGRGRDLLDLVEDVVRRGQERRELRRNVSPRLAATLLLGGFAAVLAGGVHAEGEASPEQIRRELLQTLLHGLLDAKPRLKWRPGVASGSGGTGPP